MFRGLIYALLLALPLIPHAGEGGPGAHGRLEIDAPHGPLFPGSRFPLRARGAGSPQFVLIGPGRLDGTRYLAPERLEAPTTATIVAATSDASGLLSLQLVPWPAQTRVFAVAAYDDGIALHREADGALIGILALDGGTADVAQIGETLAAPSTTRQVLWSVDLQTGVPRAIEGVPAGNEVRGFGGDAYVTNRDVDGDGALTRVSDGTATRIRTGVTAEGLAIDAGRAIAYVANVNDSSIAAIDVPLMRIAHRISAPARPFSLALDPRSRRLDVVSNVPRTASRPGGRVESIDLNGGHVLAWSAPFRFPLGVALDAKRQRLFVTDEAEGFVAVLDARSLKSLRRPLTACAIPWRPSVDLAQNRLYVPCAGANSVAIYDLRTLAPLRGSPFASGGYPLAVSAVSRRVPAKESGLGFSRG